MFCDPSVADAYACRPTYPPAVFDILRERMAGSGAVLDAGCGTGFLARELVEWDAVSHVDAVDLSSAMIEVGRELPAGDHPRLRWICAPIEEAPLEGPYALVTAGESLHWMEWDRVLPRFRSALAPGGILAVLDLLIALDWRDDVREIASRFSLNRDFFPYDMRTVVNELEARGLYRTDGEQKTEPVSRVQAIDDWIESLHARNGFSRDRMEPDAAAECDRLLRDVARRRCPDGRVELRVTGRVIWGEPCP